ncbi:hypothetical protein AKJ43_03090 [candidate division MSBL1 archaeon SCGC-AAA261D19]|uniref:Uncharacterized protein n=1 Tax=candidate division MSBL1 archaeon SCGC-AAA261D19 TaxID=1698273 RepID=A0A133V5S1_9EURY|nr:hypothetical protein AKJ43_03090 [candidate division MSBL1 archaeon SCGC-AAA261D19]
MAKKTHITKLSLGGLKGIYILAGLLGFLGAIIALPIFFVHSLGSVFISMGGVVFSFIGLIILLICLNDERKANRKRDKR